MRLAFYAPLKPPEHPVPSGDRTMARALKAALEHAGAQVDLASSLRSRDSKGDAKRQTQLIHEAEAALPDIIAQGRAAGWQAWVTYHNYYKAPDLIGPAVAQALGIPYLLIEATRARKRLDGPWDCFARRAEAASDAADVIFYLTERDHEALSAYAPAAQQLVHLRPFLPQSELPPRATGAGLLAVGMMRAAAKRASYTLIAQTMALLPTTTRLSIAGDGPDRPQIEAMMAPYGDRVQFLGALDGNGLALAYRSAGAFIWPGVDEAFGMVYLEAQAHGLPVIAQNRPGVRDVLYPNDYPLVDAGAVGLAAFARDTMPDPTDIRDHIARHHLLPAAAQTLRAGLTLAGAP